MRMMTRMFKPQLGKNIEIYIDNMVVKSKLESEHVNDLGNIFKILGRHKLRSMLPSVLLVLVQGNSWAIWSLTVELKLILIRLKQLTVYNYLEIAKKSKS